MAKSTKQEIQTLLAAAVDACEDKKAEDIRILALDPSESGLTDYFLICSGNSDRQNVAITDAIEIKLKHEFNTYPNSVEGRRQGEWILMDYVDFIVHVFSAEKRAFYGLERLRKPATVLSIAELNAELKATIAATRKKAPAVKKAVTNMSPVKKPATKKAVPKKASTKKAVKPVTLASKTAKKSPAKKTASSMVEKKAKP